MAERFVLSRPVSDRFPITQRFKENTDAYRSTSGHTGIDFDTPEGTEVHAAAGGPVSEAGLHTRSQKEPDKGYGWYVRIQHSGGFNTLYTQLRPEGVLVTPGEVVRRGQLIGYSGNSGQPGERPRLHFELRTGPSVSTATDPIPYLETDQASPDYMPFSEPGPNLENLPVSEVSGVSEVAQQRAPEYSQGRTPTVTEPGPSGPNAPASEASSVAEQSQQQVVEPAHENASVAVDLGPASLAAQGVVQAPVEPVHPTNTAEYRKGDTLVRVAQTDRPWWLEIDGLVIPAGVPYGALNGSFVTSWFEAIGPDHADAVRALVAKATLQRSLVTGLEPDKDLGEAILPFGGDLPRRIFIASATGSPGEVTGPDPRARLANIPGIITQVVSLARSQDAHRLAIPLIGSGGGGLNPLRVADVMLNGLLSEIELAPIQEITLTTLRPDVVEAARLKFNQYLNNLAQAISTDEATDEDTLGIAPQVHALAETLMLREMPGGIAVGILGSWGSGKTSVMKMIEKHIKWLLSKDQDHGKGWEEDDPPDRQVSPYVGHVYPIWFNAWTYAKGNLWASLMDRIFTYLDDELRDDTTRPKDMWEILRGRKKREWDELKEQEEKLAKLTAECQQLTLDYHKDALDDLARQGQSVAWNVFKGEIGQVAGEWAEKKLKPLLDQDGVEKDAIAVVNELHGLKANLLHLIETARKRPLFFLIWLLVSVACIVLPFILSSIFNTLYDVLITLAGLVALLLPPLRIVAVMVRQVDGSLQAFRDRTDQEQRRLQGLAEEWVQKKQAAEDERVRTLVNDGRKSPAAIEEELTWMATGVIPEQKDDGGNTTRVRQTMPKNLAAYQALVKIQQAKVEQQRTRVGMVGRFTTLAEFVQSRLDSKFYINQLGPMHQVEKDIGELSQGLVLHEDNLTKEEIKARIAELRALFPRGPARVVLFIDDLDRCPPPRVVEVLEATQLLLKTPLFVVVLGLDTRYATRALEKEYKEILQHDGDPSGMDYIEKIIQIPYRVRPIEIAGLDSFLKAQMNPLEAVSELEEGPAPTGKPADVSTPAQAQTKPAPAEISLPGDGSKPPQAGQLDASGGPAIGPSGEVVSDGSLSESQKPGPSGERTQAAKFVELPPAVVRFSQEDFEDVQACCQLIRLTPRSVKRLVNVMKLMEVFWFRTLRHDRERPVKQSVIALLTLAAAYPEVMVEVFTQMELKFDSAEARISILGDYLDELARETLRLAGPSLSVLNWQFDRLKEDATAMRLMELPDETVVDFLSTTFETLTIETFNMVRSFSFIGDPAYTLEDAARDGQPKQTAN